MYITPITNNRDSCLRLVVPKNTTFGTKYLSFNDADERIKKGNLAEVECLPDLYVVNNKLETLLHSSARYNQKEISKFLLQKGLNPNQKNFHGKTPFAIACSRLNIPHVKVFLPYNADINTQDNLNNTPLHQSVSSPEITELLLKNKANPYLKNDFGKTPFTTSFNYPETLETYLKFGINPNTVDSNSQTLMHESVIKQKLDNAQLLKKYNADTNYIDKWGRSPIFYFKDTNTLKWLVANGAKINLTDKNNQTVLHLNVINNDIKKVNALLQLGADPNIQDNKNLPPLAYAKTTKMMELLLKNKANPDVRTPKGSTILHNVTKTNNIEGIYYLTSYHANPNIPDKDYKIPYDYTSCNNAKILLLAAGSNPNFKNYLKDALQKNNQEIFEYLLECGANPNRPDEYGKTSIFYVRNEEQINELKKYNVDLNFYNKDGYTPILHYALLGEKDMVRLLKNNGADDLKSLNGESLEDCYKKYETYSPWLKSVKKQTTFTGNPYYIYGTPKLREDLNYKTQLTKEKIDKIISNAKNTDEGIIEAYKELSKEEVKIYTAMNALGPVLEHFDFVIKDDINKIAKKNPSLSKLPVIGLISQLIETKFSDDFIKEVESEARNIANQYEDIITHYYSNGIKINAAKYNELNKYLYDGVKYINYVKGENATRNKVIEKLSERNEKFNNRHRKYINSINKQSKKYERLVDKLINFQENKQEKRIMRKAMIKIIFLGTI